MKTMLYYDLDVTCPQRRSWVKGVVLDASSGQGGGFREVTG